MCQCNEKEAAAGGGRKLNVLNRHVLASIGVYAGDELAPAGGDHEYEGDYFENSEEKGAEELVREFYETLCAYSDLNYRRLRTKSESEGGYAHIYEQLDELHATAEASLALKEATQAEEGDIKRAKAVLRRVTTLRNEFDNYCRQLLVFGFHSNGYDLPLIAGTLTRVLYERNPWKPTGLHDRRPRDPRNHRQQQQRQQQQAREEAEEEQQQDEEEEEEEEEDAPTRSKRQYNPTWSPDDPEEDDQFVAMLKRTGSKYICFATHKLKFMDAKEFVGPACDLVRFLKCFLPPRMDGEPLLRKLWFPYEKLRSLDDLKLEGLPAYEDFYSSLKGANTLDDGTGDEAVGRDNHAYLSRVWEEKGMRCLGDLLRLYQLADCKPFYTALRNMADKYAELGVRDPFENLTLASLAWNFVVDNQCGGRLYNTPEHLSDWYHQLRANVVGGFTSILDQNYCEPGTPVGENEYGETALPARRVQVWDFNSLYPYVMSRQLPTSTPCVRHFPDWKLRTFETRLANSRIGILYGRWLAWSQKRHFAHAGNGREVRILGTYPVDVFETGTTNCWDLHGCFYHHHEASDCPLARRGAADPEAVALKHAADARKAAFIREAGYTYEVVWECEFRAQLRSDPRCREFLAAREAEDRTPFAVDFERDGQLDTMSCFGHEKTPTPGTITLETILAKVESGELFGFVEVDVRVKEKYRRQYRKFPIIIARQHVDRSMFTGAQLEMAERHNMVREPVSTVAGVHEATHYLAITPMVQAWLALTDDETGECVVEITHVHQIVEYTSRAVLEGVMERLVKLRIEGDGDSTQSVLSEMAKLIMNASYGRSIMRRDRHTRTEIARRRDAQRLVNDPLYRSLTPLLTADELMEQRNRDGDAPPQHDLPARRTDDDDEATVPDEASQEEETEEEEDPEEELEEEEEEEVFRGEEEGQQEEDGRRRRPLYEVQMSRKSVCADLPLHMGVWILQAAKLRNMEAMRTLERYLDPRKWTSLYCDTDSLFLALTEDSLDDCVLEVMREDWFKHGGARQRLFVDEFCKKHQSEFIETKCRRREQWDTEARACCKAERAEQSRRPGLLKMEFEGDSFCALCPKSYVVVDEAGNVKKTHKGVQKRAAQHLDFETYRGVRSGDECLATNTGIRVLRGSVVTYEQRKKALHPVDIKRQLDERYPCHTNILDAPARC